MTYFGHIMRKKGKCLEKEIIQGTTRVPAKRVDEMIGQYQTLDGADKGRTVEDRQMGKIVVHDAVQCCHSKTVVHNLFRPRATNRFPSPFGGQTSLTMYLMPNVKMYEDDVDCNAPSIT